jgi:phage-related protein
MWNTCGVNAPLSREVIWVGSSLKDLRRFPEEVRQIMGFALYLAETGSKHPAAKPLKGFRGASVLEVVDDYQSDTYRVVYTLRFAGHVYVLHAFQKKAKRGVATPKRDTDLVCERLEQARLIDAWRRPPAAGDGA